QVVWNALAALELVEADKTFAQLNYPSQIAGKELIYDEIKAPSEGLIRFLVHAGELVEEGQEIARLINPLNQHAEQKVVATHRGLILGLTDTALATPGTALVALGLLPNQN